MDQLVDYLKNMYKPLAVIVYSSFADSSNNEGSDFDALVIAMDHPLFHDVSFVGGIQLDVFVYPQTYFKGNVDWENFIRLFDGRIVLDTEGEGQRLLNRIQTFCLAAGHPYFGPKKSLKRNSVSLRLLMQAG